MVELTSGRVVNAVRRRWLLSVGLTAVFVGYLMVWLPGPGAGLQLIGVELPEWIKFLGVGRRRDLLYLPPVLLGGLLALWTATWPSGRPRTWLARLLAVAVAGLAFPAIASIAGEPADQWLARLALIAAVAAVAVLSALLARAGDRTQQAVWVSMALIAVIGAIVPTWQYLALRPVVEEILRVPVGIGPGVWLSALGFLAAATAAALEFAAGGAKRKKRQPPEERLPANIV